LSGDHNSKKVLHDHFLKKYENEIVKYLNIADLQKFEMDKSSKIGKEFEMGLELGRPFSLNAKIEMLKQSIFSGKSIKKQKNIILLDGFPSDVYQAEQFEKNCIPIEGMYKISASDCKNVEELKLEAYFAQKGKFMRLRTIDYKEFENVSLMDPSLY